MATSNARKAQAPARILLVDDHKSGLSARRAVLEEVGYETIGLCCPKEALSLFRKESFDLVVTDYRMPGVTGTDLIRELKDAKPDVPVILLSGYIEPLGLTEKATGADAVIMKSAHEVQHLLRATSRLVNLKMKRKMVGSEAAPAKGRRKIISSS
jgi:two-component system, cell cycle sensor histidine kinase and response regulator CckA